MDKKIWYYISKKPDMRYAARNTGWSYNQNSMDYLNIKEVSFIEYSVYCVAQDIALFVRKVKKFLKGDK